MQDVNCENNERVDKMAEDIPSFKKKWTMDPFTHNDFMFPRGEQGRELISYIVEAIEDARPQNDWISELWDDQSHSSATRIFTTLIALSLTNLAIVM